jgi:type 1 fimbria pilin
MKNRLAAAIILVLASTTLFAHGGHPHVRGTVAAVTSSVIEVKTTEGKLVDVPLPKVPTVLVGSKRGTIADAKKGLRVVVHLDAQGKAAEIHLPPR